MTLVAAFTFPWEVIGDPRAAGRLRDLGADTAVLAAAYHSTTAITPRHPVHRIVQARHSAVYYPPDPARWQDSTLRPAAQSWTGTQDPYGAAAGQLRDAGLAVHAWVVLTHNSRLAQSHPEQAIRNAYGDRYGWALCAAQPEVRAYAAALAAECATRPGTSGVELEACGWYGCQHLHAHDKTDGVRLGTAGAYLLSLCFCRTCQEGYARHGVDPGRLRKAVAEALEPLWHSGADPAAKDDYAWETVRDLLGLDLAEATLAYRVAAARRLRQGVIAAVRAQAPGCRIVLRADPAPYRTGADSGVLAGQALEDADGLVAWAEAVDAVTADATPAGTVPAGKALAAIHHIISAAAGNPDFNTPAGATEIRLYHPGLASDQDLRVAAAAVNRFLSARAS
ncbi:MAG TPA: hypothetical protein VHT26_12825 [Trebonia sp.]|nr:hypothetical protein [Trebonia sp.]